jgi:hypothetical protein
MMQAWLGDVEHLERFEPFIDRDSADQLRDYFRLGGLARFDKSPMANMLANAEMFSAYLSPCIYCGGKRHKDDPSLDTGGTGFVGDTTKWTPAMFKRINGMLSRMGMNGVDVHSGIDCPVCKCSGWVTTGGRKKSGQEITARPTGSSAPGNGNDNGIDVALGTCAFVERILDRADVLFVHTTPVLASCYGTQNYGPIGVWHMTPAGKTLLKRNGKDKDPVIFFIELRTEEDGKRTKILSEQLKAADEQARAAIDTAHRAWNAALFVDRCGL